MSILAVKTKSRMNKVKPKTKAVCSPHSEAIKLANSRVLAKIDVMPEVELNLRSSDKLHFGIFGPEPRQINI